MLYEMTKKKLKIVIVGALIFVGAIILKLGYIQIVDHEEIFKKAKELWQRSFPVEATRGEVVDKNGEVLATSLTKSSLVVIPSQIKDPANCADIIGKIIGVDPEILYEKFIKKVSIQRISPEGRQLDDEVAYRIDKLKLPGIYLIKDTKRYYPNDSYLAHTLGFVGIDNQGLLGLELMYNDILSGQNGSINYFMDAKGKNVDLYPSDYSAPSQGQTIRLTIDKDIQDIVERELNNAYKTYNPEAIWALAMNPNNGQILAMSSKPDFNPNDYQNSDPDIYNRNLPLYKTYEPGSTFKIITFASALNEGVIDLDEQKYHDIGYEYVGSTRIKSWKKGGHGLQTFREVLQNSSNPGFVEIGRRLGKDNIYHYVENFGLSTKTRIDLPGESNGIMFDYENFNELEQATVAFGQGISTTAMQLVSAVSACVNGGNLYTPYIVDGVIHSMTGDEISKTKPNLVRTVISEETSLKVKDALESVVSNGGGRNAYIEGYPIGGKTGTAQKAIDGVYVDGQYILSFIGVAPINDPQIVLYVAMDNPKNCIQYGGTTVAPIARNMLVDILPTIGIKKTKDQKPKVKNYLDSETVIVEQFIGKTKSEVKQPYLKFKFMGEGNTVIDQLPRAGEVVETNREIVILLD